MTPARAQKIFITGASTGIGEALARHYAARGAQLGLVARRRELLENLAATLDPEPLVYAADVRDAEAMRAAAGDFIARAGLPDIVIANAGVSVGTLTERPDDLAVFRQVFDINVLGMLHTFHPFVEPMKAAGKGTLVGIASVAGFRGIPGGGAYSASKAACISYCESLRVELKQSGVSVVTICPGYIRTPMTAVNKFKMPFLIEVDDAVARFARAIDARTSFTVIPWTMGIAARVLRVLPNWLYDRVFQRMPRKPRAGGGG
ncbi:MAG TPA: SDR family oxidoreductase [Usitatibacteraceae bacterium]|nr:SDR family oxidoreductase [Usitatibacteraceae bacterium]